MNIHKIHDLSNPFIIRILEEGLGDVGDGLFKENYSPEHRLQNSNLFYILDHGRYIDGCYFVIEDNGKLMACAGWNKYDDNTAIVLSRAYVTPRLRASYIMGEKLLPIMIMDTNLYKNVWITCNEYNRPIYRWFERKSMGLAPAIFNNWPDIYSRFDPIGKKLVYNTYQYVVQLRK